MRHLLLVNNGNQGRKWIRNKLVIMSTRTSINPKTFLSALILLLVSTIAYSQEFIMPYEERMPVN